jgi:ribA/ribD-fused uncharacterized protein
MEANRLGRQIRDFDSEKWRSMVDEIAEECNWLKFSQIEEGRDALLATGHKTLAEASPVDRNWGIGFRGDEAEGHENEWGKTILGQALMRVRARLRHETEV